MAHRPNPTQPVTAPGAHSPSPASPPRFARRVTRSLYSEPSKRTSVPVLHPRPIFDRLRVSGGQAAYPPLQRRYLPRPPRSSPPPPPSVIPAPLSVIPANAGISHTVRQPNIIRPRASLFFRERGNPSGSGHRARTAPPGVRSGNIQRPGRFSPGPDTCREFSPPEPFGCSRSLL